MLKNLLITLLESIQSKRENNNAKLQQQIVDLKNEVETLKETIKDYITMEAEAIAMANQIKEVVDLWES